VASIRAPLRDRQRDQFAGAGRRSPKDKNATAPEAERSAISAVPRAIPSGTIDYVAQDAGNPGSKIVTAIVIVTVVFLTLIRVLKWTRRRPSAPASATRRWNTRSDTRRLIQQLLATCLRNRPVQDTHAGGCVETTSDRRVVDEVAPRSAHSSAVSMCWRGARPDTRVMARLWRASLAA
jgi:hypothetical protein